MNENAMSKRESPATMNTEPTMQKVFKFPTLATEPLMKMMTATINRAIPNSITIFAMTFRLKNEQIPIKIKHKMARTSRGIAH